MDVKVYCQVVVVGVVVFWCVDVRDVVKYFMYGGCVGFGEIFMVDYVMCVSMFKYVVFMCII